MNTMLKYIICVFALVIGVLEANAEWPKGTRKEFNKSKGYRVVIDMNETNYEGMDSIGFVEYNAAKNKMTSSDFAVILKHIDDEIAKHIAKKTGEKNVPRQQTQTA